MVRAPGLNIFSVILSFANLVLPQPWRQEAVSTSPGEQRLSQGELSALPGCATRTGSAFWCWCIPELSIFLGRTNFQSVQRLNLHLPLP